MSHIGRAIATERRRAGLTSRRLAELVTLTPQYVRLIECGGAIPAVQTVLKIANQFPDADTAGWLWLLLRDTWGSEIASLMERDAVARRDEQRKQELSDLRAAREEAARLRATMTLALDDIGRRDELGAIDALRAALAATEPSP